MNDLARLKFDGAPVPWRPAPLMDHGVALSINDVSRLLGYTSNFATSRVVSRNAKHFKASEATTTSFTSDDGRKRKMWVLSPRGLLRFCLFARTPAAFRFYDALLNFLDNLASGDSVVVDRATYDRLTTSAHLNSFFTLARISAEQDRILSSLRDIGRALPILADRIADAAAGLRVNPNSLLSGRLNDHDKRRIKRFRQRAVSVLSVGHDAIELGAILRKLSADTAAIAPPTHQIED